MKPLKPLEIPLNGLHLIEASAGTGKTYTITTLFVRLIVERNLDVDQILVVTFTEAATAELRDRVRGRLRSELSSLDTGEPTIVNALLAERPALAASARRALVRALRDFDRASISTIHGFCHRTLNENAFECSMPFEAELEANIAPVVRELVLDLWARHTYGASPLYCRFLRAQKVTPDLLQALAQKAVTHPEAAVIPEAPPPENPDALAAFEAAFAEASAAWRTGQGAVGEILLGDPGLNRTKYGLKRVPKWLEELASLFADPSPRTADLPSWFVGLTPAGLKAGTRKKETTPEHPFFVACDALHAAAAALSSELSRRMLALKLEVIDQVERALPQRKERLGVLAFDDLLGRLNAALRGDGADRLRTVLRARYRAALIDEFQDTDPIQYEIFERAFGQSETPVFLIGDPKQAIYGFRGADIFAYLEACKAAGDHAYTLGTNRRSDAKLVSAVNQLFERAQPPFIFDQIRYPRVAAHHASAGLELGAHARAPFEVLQHRRPDQDASKLQAKERARPAVFEGVAADIARLLNAKPRLTSREPVGPGEAPASRSLEPGDIAVLVSRNVEARIMQQHLRELGIPSVLRSAGTVFESDEANELFLLMRAVVEPGDGARVRGALTTGLFGLTGNDIDALSRDESAWDAWIGVLRRWQSVWRERGFIQMFRGVLQHRASPGAAPVFGRLLASTDGERRLTNVLHLGELMHAAARAEHLGMSGLLRWLERSMHDPKRASDTAELRLESDAKAVKLVTVHGSKGLEYPVVYCLSLWEGSQLRSNDKAFLFFHDPEDDNRAKLDVRSPDASKRENLAHGGRELQAESMRVAYVALTRAQNLCKVAWGAINGAETSPLGYLLHHRAEADPSAATTAFIEGASDAALRADLEALATGSGGAIACRDLASEAAMYVAGTDSHRDLDCRRLGRAIDASWRVSSYSKLASRRSPVDPQAEEERDHDVGLEVSVLPSLVEAPKPAASETIALVDFPKGGDAGTCLHEIYEEIDFTEARGAGFEAQVHDVLEGHGYPPETWTAVVASALADTLDTPLNPEGLRLRDVPRARRLNELAFALPVENGDHGGGSGLLSPSRLADAFASCSSAPWGTAYADALRRLRFTPMQGSLKGFIDLVFEHEGKWYVADYKSNFLGTRYVDYGPSKMLESMIEHHYVLQYHIYALALHRYLGQRLRGYAYEQHFGGVYYLFIRGMSAETGAEYGVFFDRPPAERMHALDALLGGGRAAAGRLD